MSANDGNPGPSQREIVMATSTVAREKSDFTLLYPIVGSHIRRIGLLRVIAGGGSMYLSIPIQVLFHTTLAVAFYQWFVRPLFGIPRVLWRNHVLLDRRRIRGLSAIDKLNCEFCGYANGLTTMMNMELDHLSHFKGNLPLWKKVLVGLLSVPALSILATGEIFGMQVIYNILVSRPLGMHRVTMAEAAKVLAKHGYGSQFPFLGKLLIQSAKNLFFRFSMALEQIESAWCPLKYIEQREGFVHPEHHKKFFGPDELEKMRRVLSDIGTVSDRTPTW